MSEEKNTTSSSYDGGSEIGRVSISAGYITVFSMAAGDTDTINILCAVYSGLESIE